MCKDEAGGAFACGVAAEGRHSLLPQLPLIPFAPSPSGAWLAP